MKGCNQKRVPVILKNIKFLEDPMRTNTNQYAKEIPLPSSYGAAELIISIRRNTMKSIFVAASVLALMVTSALILISDNNGGDRPILLGSRLEIGTFTVETKTPEIPVDVRNIEKLPVDIPVSKTGTGLEEVSGTFIPAKIGETDIATKIASVSQMKLTTSTPGNGILPMPKQISDPSYKMEKVEDVNIAENPDIILFLDKDPSINLGKLSQIVEYPRAALASNLNGKVVLNVLINEEGYPIKVLIVETTNAIFNNSAINAIYKYGSFDKATQQGQATKYWMIIPIDYKMR